MKLQVSILLLSCLQETSSVEPSVLSCDEKAGNLLLQTHAEAAFAKRSQGFQPWDHRNYLVATSHKAGSHLLRNVMRRTFDVLGANYSCHYNSGNTSAVITSRNGDHYCIVEKAPIRFQNGNNARTILGMRKEGPMRGVMIMRDPFDMVTSAYVYHHRGAEKGSPDAPKNITSLNPWDGVPAVAQTMWSVIEDMTKAYIARGDDVLPVKFEDFTKSSSDFDQTMERILNFLFADEITGAQRSSILKSTKKEDINGPWGLNQSLDVQEEKSYAKPQPNHTNDEGDLENAQKALPLIPKELHDKYTQLRKTLGYA